MEQGRETINEKNLMQYLHTAASLREKKQFNEALTITDNCLKIFPKNCEIHALKGIIHLDQEKYIYAEKSLHMAISLAPKRVDFYFLLGQLLKKQNRNQEAENAYQQCLKLNKNYVQAIFSLGVLYENLNKLNEAVYYFKKVIKLKPDYSKAHYNLAVIYHKLNNVTLAIPHYQKALLGDPKNASILTNLGAALTKDRQFKKAIEYLEKALFIAPNYIPAMTNLGGVYIEMNQLKKAMKWMRCSLDLNPNLPPNWRNLTLCTTYHSAKDPDCLKIKALLNEKVSNENKVHYYFALGKIYDDCKHYDEAFTFYEKGNTLLAQTTVFKPQVFASHINRVIEIFDETRLQHIQFKAVDPKPLIIVGTPRSGKSLLESLLVQHPHIKGAGEVGFADVNNSLGIDSKFKGNYPYWLKTLTFEEAKAIKDAYYQRLSRDTQKDDRYVIDTVPGNFMYLGLLSQLFSGAKIIHCQRNALDACLLMYFKYFVQGHGYSYDMKKLGSYYQSYEKIMNYWKKILSHAILDVPYETLVNSTRQTLRKVMEFLELDANYQFDCKKIKSEGIDHWRHYEKYLDPLKKSLTDEIKIEDSKSTIVDKVKELMSSAYIHYTQGNYPMAQNYVQTILEEDPNHYPAYHLLGMIHYNSAKYSSAINALEKAIAISPTNSQIHIDLANALKKDGKQMQAQKHLKIAEQIQIERQKKQVTVLSKTQKEILLKPIVPALQIIDEFETRILLKGQFAENLTTDSYMTSSWDQYFTDLSFGRFRTIPEVGKHAWRMRTWHYLYKNIALVEELMNHNSPLIHVLDVGCSTGYLRRFLEGNIDPNQSKQYYYWGIDIRQDVLESAVKAVDDIESGAKGNLVPSAFIVHDLSRSLPFQDSFFDYVVSFETIKYLPIDQGKNLLSQINRVLSLHGKFYLSTTYEPQQPGFMQSVPFEQIENMLHEQGFEIIQRRGSQADFKRLLPYFHKAHLPLINDLLKVHPAEMVAAMLTPLYPQCAEQVTFICKHKDK